MNAYQAIKIIEDAYVGYYAGWDGFGTHSGVCLAIVEDLVAHGLAVDDKTGEASLEARIARVLDGYAGEHVHSGEFAAEVAVELGLATADEALEATG